MKNTTLEIKLCLLLLLCFFNAHGKNYLPTHHINKSTHFTYYVDAVLGNDINDGKSISKPWKSLEAVNAFGFQPGDNILFKRGQSFNGRLRIANSGVKSDNIIYGAYGSGEKPIINGLTKLTHWKNIGHGIWQSTCQTCNVNLKVVLMNNEEKPVGRYPNFTAPNQGYLKYQSHLNKNTIINNDPNDTVNWTGAEAVVRRTQWSIDNGLITANSPHNITYKSTSQWGLSDGFGYFIQNDPRTLDQLGEWSYNAGSNELQLFFGEKSPDSYEIKVCDNDDLVTIKGVNYITVQDISFYGSNVATVRINNSDHISVKNCDINFSGKDAINANPSATNLVLDGNKIDHTYNTAIQGYNCLNAIIKNNTISNTGLVPGMGRVYSAIDITGDNVLICLNNIEKCGYNGIQLFGNNCIIKENAINNFNMILDDGGGIYLGGSQYRGRQVIGNIVTNGIGNPHGSSWPGDKNTEGIYADDNTSDIKIVGNTVANVAGRGIKIHNAHAITVRNNTLFNNQMQLILYHDSNPAGGPIHDIILRNNFMVSKTNKQNQLVLVSTVDDIRNFGLIDSNYYVQPNNGGNNSFSMTVRVANNEKYYDFTQWQKTFTFDQNSKMNMFQYSKEDVNQILFEYNITAISKKIALGKVTYFDAKNKLYTDNVTLAPYSSILLFKKN